MRRIRDHDHHNHHDHDDVDHHNHDDVNHHDVYDVNHHDVDQHHNLLTISVCRLSLDRKGEAEAGTRRSWSQNLIMLIIMMTIIMMMITILVTKSDRGGSVEAYGLHELSSKPILRNAVIIIRDYADHG